MLNLRRLRRWGAWLGMALLAWGLIVGCQGRTNLTETADTCTPVEHAAGTTCVPEQFERLVTLDGVSFEYAIATGLSPLATASGGYMEHLEQELAQAEEIGQTGEPSLERTLTLKPDLILGLDFNQNIYSQAARIAPTLLFSFGHSGQWKQVFERMAEGLGRAEAAQQAMAAYEARLADFKAQMGDRLNDLKVSMVRIYPDTINLYLRDSFAGTVLQDAGLARPEAQDIGAEEAAARFNNPIQVSISRELFSQADGDVIFLWIGENTAEGAESAQQRLQALQQDPLWQQLSAVQQGRVYEVPGYWLGSGPIAANRIVDDLFKYLVEGA